MGEIRINKYREGGLLMQGWKENEEKMMSIDEEIYSLMWNALDDMAANAYDLYDENAEELATETLDKVEELENE
jgi:hypothetical protein